MKLVLDNIIFYLQRSGGGSVYWMELVKRALNDKSFEAECVEPVGNHSNLVRKQNNLKVSYFEKLPLILLRLSRFTVPVSGKYIFHSSYYRISASKNAVNVVTIHDFTSEFFLKGLRKYIHKSRKRRAIKHADGIICISNNTRNDLLELYKWAGKKKIKVIYNGVGDEYFVIDPQSDLKDFSYKHLIKEKYILYVGHRTSYKNFAVAAEAVASLGNETRFLIIGEPLSEAEKTNIDYLLKDRYLCLSGIDNQTLNIFYNYAFCLLYPSNYEGFGIPIIEAMRAGCPVVTTNRSSIPEVAGDAALTISETDALHFADAVKKLDDKDLRKEIVRKGKIQAMKFSWSKTYEEVRQFYIELYNEVTI